MRRTVTSLVALSLAMGTGIAAHASPEAPPQPGTTGTTEAARAGAPVETTRPAADTPRRVMVLLKQQPHGKGDRAKGLAAVDRVLGRWNGREGFSVDRKFGMLVNGFSATLPANQMASLAADPDVASVQPLKIFYPSMQTAGELTQSVAARSNHGVDGRGLVVSVIDTGIDIDHQDMRLDDGVQGKLPVTEGFNAKVPYGWNFADENADVYDTGSQHGMHVAGIVAANGGADADVLTNGRINGIAPNAQLLAMKVFSNDPLRPGAYEDDIIAAIEASVDQGADIINMSLGSPNGTNQSSVGEGRAIANAQAAGVQVIVAAGNEGLSGSPGGGLDDVLDVLDDGSMGSPASSLEALAVASVNNVASIATLAKVTAAGETTEVGYQLQSGTADGQPHTVVYGGLGKPEEIPAEASGNYILIERGEISFGDKFKNAIAKGATGVLVYNHADGGDAFAGMAGIEGYTIPGVFLHHSVGEDLRAKIAAGPTTITLTDDAISLPVVDEASPSYFSSWGATPELDFKPQIAGIGGSVYSTYNDDQYADSSGTSMAAPHVAGVFALGLQEYAERFPEASAVDRNTWLRTAMSNTAEILEHDGTPYAPRQMGAGLVQTDVALTTNVFATVAGDPTVALREIDGPATFTVTLTNRGEEEYTFTTGGTCVLAESQDPAGNATSCSDGETLTASASEVTVAAGGTATVDFTVTPTTSEDHWIQGWAQLASDDDAQPDLSLPYLGFVGDWNAEPIVDAPVSSGESVMAELFGEKTMHRTTLVGNFPLIGAVQNEWFSPNGDGAYDEVFAQLMLLRSAGQVEYEILRDGELLTKLGSERDLQRLTMATLAGLTDSGAHTALGHKWNGTLYDPATDSWTDAPDGKYTLRVKARLGEDFEWQTTDLPFGLDRVAPEVEISHAANDDGSLTYTAKITDDASGVQGSTVVASNGLTNTRASDLVWDEATGTATFTVPASWVTEGNYVRVQVRDRAGNQATEVDFLGAERATFLSGWRYDKWVTSTTMDVLTFRPLVNDGMLTLTVVASDGVARVTVNGEDVELVDGQGTVEVPVASGERTEFELVAYDAAGNELNRESRWIGIDDEAPTLEVTGGLNDRGEAVVAADGSITITGKVTDNVTSVADGTLFVLRDGQDFVFPEADGSFTYTFTPGDAQATFSLVAMEYQNDNIVNVTTVSVPIEGRTTPGSALRITFDDPRMNSVYEEEQFGQFAYFLDPSWEGLTATADGAQLVVSGKFDGRPGSFVVDGREVAVDDQQRFEFTLDLTNGINHVGYEVTDTDGNRVVMGSWRFFYDANLPGYTVETDPRLNADGAIYITEPESEVSVQGEVWDNEFGYRMAVNGSVVKDFENLFDPGAEQNRRPYETTVTAKAGEMVRISVSDQMANGYEQGIPVVYDEAAPEVTIDGVTDGEYIESSRVITVLATDANLETLTVLVDGEEHAAKVVDVQPHTGAYLVPFVNGEPQLDDAVRALAEDGLVELTVEVTGLPVGRHVLEAVATDKADRVSTAAVTFIVDDAAPVIEGPDELTVNPDEDVLAQIRDAYTVTDDVDEELELVVEGADRLVIGEPGEVTLTAVDASGKVTTRTVTVTLERPMTTLTGECGSMTAPFVKGETITITCVEQADGSVIVTVENSGGPIEGTLRLDGLTGPVYLLDSTGRVVTQIGVTPVDGGIEFTSSSKAVYRVGELPPDKGGPGGKQPIDGHKPGEPIKRPGLPSTGN